MSLVSRLITALLGLALFWFFWPFGSGGDEVITAVSPPVTPDERLFTKPGAPTSQGQAPAPGQGAPKQAATGSNPQAPQPQMLAREKADADRLAALKTEAETEPIPRLKPQRFYRVVVRDGGTIEAGDTVIALGGIKARAADATCKDAAGKTWACGAGARLALTRLIRGRAVVCEVPISGNAKAVTARCSLAGTDLSVWMVSQGWVEPAAQADPKLAEAADEARKKKAGIWR
jgi:endonuclease YncB( thermonuclease family)